MSDSIAMIGHHVRDRTTGIAGRVTAVCHYEHDAPQLRLRRYGVNSSGNPFDVLWVNIADCAPTSEEDARQ